MASFSPLSILFFLFAIFFFYSVECLAPPAAPYIPLGISAGSANAFVYFPTANNQPFGTSPRTITMMVNYTSINFIPTSNAFPPLITMSNCDTCNGACSGGNEFNFYLYQGGSGALGFQSCNRGNWQGGQTPQISAGTWFHAAITYDGSNIVQITLNANSATQWSWGVGGITAFPANFLLGARFRPGSTPTTSPYPPPPPPFQGWIDNVHIYNRVLSLSDLTQDLNGNTNLPGLVGSWDGTTTPNNQLKDLTANGNNGIFVFNLDGTAPGAGALTQIVLYTTGAGIVGMQTTFGGTTHPLIGASSATPTTVTIQPAEYIVQVTSWYSGSQITGIQFLTSTGNELGPYGQLTPSANVQGNPQASPAQALVGISGTYSQAGVMYPLHFAWATSPYATNTMSGGNFDINTNCGLAHVQTVTFFLYNGPGTQVPNYICGFEVSAGGYPSIIAGAFAWPDPTGTISTQTISVPPGDMFNKWNLVVCNIAPNVATLCGVTLISITGIQWTVGTTIAQAQNFGYVPLALNYGQTTASSQCNFHGFYGPYQTVVQNGYTLPYFVQPALHD